jgi:hypothetical protein
MAKAEPREPASRPAQFLQLNRSYEFVVGRQDLKYGTDFHGSNGN